jgi:hypothetical protein
MPNYQKSKIYCIVPIGDSEDGDIYYGATTVELSTRLRQHKQLKCSSRILFQKYGIDNVKIVLIKEFPCKTKNELSNEEAKYITGGRCVNKCVPLHKRDPIYHKNWYIQHAEEVKEKKRKYYLENRDKIRTRKAAHYQRTKH